MTYNGVDKAHILDIENILLIKIRKKIMLFYIKLMMIILGLKKYRIEMKK